MTIETFEAGVCIDCLMMIANGDSSGIDDFPAWESRVDSYDATEGGRWAVVPDSDGEQFFSWASCDYCGTCLGGDRFPVTFIDSGAVYDVENSGHVFKPYADDPDLCCAEIPSTGETCNRSFSDHPAGIGR